jgi:hypothetical protein
MPIFRELVQERFLAEGEIEISNIISFEFKKSLPILGKPSVVLSFYEAYSLSGKRTYKTQSFIFPNYLFKPSRSFYEFIDSLRKMGVKEPSD